MTPREVVTRAIEFNHPERLPINGYGGVSDVIGVGRRDIRPPEAGDDPNVDQWLCRWYHLNCLEVSSCLDIKSCLMLSTSADISYGCTLAERSTRLYPD